MVDWGAAIFATILGLAGGAIWWLRPPTPKDVVEVSKRFAAGMLAGFLWHVVTGRSPFDASGNWNPEGVVELIGIGYAGLAGIASLLPKQLDAGSMEYQAKDLRKMVNDIRDAAGRKDLATVEANLHSLEEKLP